MRYKLLLNSPKAPLRMKKNENKNRLRFNIIVKKDENILLIIVSFLYAE